MCTFMELQVNIVNYIEGGGPASVHVEGLLQAIYSMVSNLIIGNAIVSNLVITMFVSYTCTVHLSIEGWRHALLNRDFLPPHVIKLGTSRSVLQPVQPTSSEDHSLPHMKVTNTLPRLPQPCHLQYLCMSEAS